MQLREQLGSGARRVWRVRFLGVADVSQRCFCSRPCETPVRDSMTPTGENWKQQRGWPRILPPEPAAVVTDGWHLLEAHVQGGWHRTPTGVAPDADGRYRGLGLVGI